MHSKLLHLSIKYLLITISCNAQNSKPFFDKDSIDNYALQQVTTTHKTIPVQYEAPIKIALRNYPELQNITIKFRVKKQQAPLSARPSIGSTFLRAANRTY